jgi:hypothetical protein
MARHRRKSSTGHRRAPSLRGARAHPGSASAGGTASGDPSQLHSSTFHGAPPQEVVDGMPPRALDPLPQEAPLARSTAARMSPGGRRAPLLGWVVARVSTGDTFPRRCVPVRIRCLREEGGNDRGGWEQEREEVLRG